MKTDRLHSFVDALAQSLRDGSFVKLTMAGYCGADKDLQKIIARPILVKKEYKISFTYRYKTRDIVKNYDVAQSAKRVQDCLADFAAAALYTTQQDIKLENGKLRSSAPTQTVPVSLAHDRAKQRPVASDRPYLQALGVTDTAGKVRAASQDKYRQINKYIEILGGLVGKLPQANGLRIVDMGAGKGYLTFALYDHLAQQGLRPTVTGVEFREELVAMCNGIARQSAFEGLHFVPGAIDGFDAAGTDVLIALHACDTATDDAIAKGIAVKAALIVVAPCCHKQVRRDMEQAQAFPYLNFLLRHGTLLERQAEMVTDGLRALLLERAGYRTNLFEFVSDAHTPKNLMLTAVRGEVPSAKRRAELDVEIARAKEPFGIRQHYLETLLGGV